MSVSLLGANVDTDANLGSLEWPHNRLAQDFEIPGDLIARAKKKGPGLQPGPLEFTNPQQKEENTLNASTLPAFRPVFSRGTDLDTNEPANHRTAVVPTNVGDGPHLIEVYDSGDVVIAIADRVNTMSIFQAREFAAEILAVAAAAEKAAPKSLRRSAAVNETFLKAD